MPPDFGGSPLAGGRRSAPEGRANGAPVETQGVEGGSGTSTSSRGSRIGLRHRQASSSRIAVGGSTAQLAFGISVAVVSGLPGTCHGALSISSGYETFLMQIRQRIVCAEDDVFDEAAQQAWAQPCDSMKDGPFCRGLPEMGATSARHRPFTLDSIVPQHLFGDPRASMELSALQGGEADTSTNKQATTVLNQFLEEFYKPRDAAAKIFPVEGRLDFVRIPMDGAMGLSSGFSRGFPPGVLASWEGSWQAEMNSIGLDSLRPRSASTVLRLNGAIGSIRFSRPVVLRSLMVRPPMHAVAGHHRLWVRARKAGKEVWRHEYDFNASVGLQHRVCAPGDLVMGRWSGDGRRYLAYLLIAHKEAATVHWVDNDHRHRLVAWPQLTTPDGKPCQDMGRTTSGGSTSSRAPRETPSLWQDLARRTKAIDEVSFLVPFGDQGWLLSELGVAAMAWRPEADSKDSDDSVGVPPDETARVVQVLPGPHALIETVSRAGVFYDADHMLEQGLRLNGWSAQPSTAQDTRLANALRDAMSSISSPSSDLKSTGDSTKLSMSSFRSVEGLKQFIRALMEDSGRPAVQALDVSKTEDLVVKMSQKLDDMLPSGVLERQEKVVKRYGHFEAFFADHWAGVLLAVVERLCLSLSPTQFLPPEGSSGRFVTRRSVSPQDRVAFGRSGFRRQRQQQPIREPAQESDCFPSDPQVLADLLARKAVTTLQIGLGEKSSKQVKLGRRLFKAAAQGDDDECRALLEKRTDLLQRDEAGRIPLHVASTPSVVALLLQSNPASAAIRSWAGLTPAESVARSAESSEHCAALLCEFARSPGVEGLSSVLDDASLLVLSLTPAAARELVRTSALGFRGPGPQDVAEVLLKVEDVSQGTSSEVSRSCFFRRLHLLRQLKDRLPAGVEAAALRHLLYEAGGSCGPSAALEQVWRIVMLLFRQALPIVLAPPQEGVPQDGSSEVVGDTSCSEQGESCAELLRWLLEAVSGSPQSDEAEPLLAETQAARRVSFASCLVAFLQGAIRRQVEADLPAEHLESLQLPLEPLSTELLGGFSGPTEGTATEKVPARHSQTARARELDALRWLAAGLPAKVLSSRIAPNSIAELRTDVVLADADLVDFELSQVPAWASVRDLDLEAALVGLELDDPSALQHRCLAEDLVLAANAVSELGGASTGMSAVEAAFTWLHSEHLWLTYTKAEPEVQQALIQTVSRAWGVESYGRPPELRLRTKAPYEIWKSALELYSDLGGPESPATLVCDILSAEVELVSAAQLRDLHDSLCQLQWQLDDAEVVLQSNGFSRDFGPGSCSALSAELFRRRELRVSLLLRTHCGPMLAEVRLKLVPQPTCLRHWMPLLQDCVLGRFECSAKRESWGQLVRILDSLAQAASLGRAAPLLAALESAQEQLLVGGGLGIRALGRDALRQHVAELWSRYRALRDQERELADNELQLERRTGRARHSLHLPTPAPPSPMGEVSGSTAFLQAGFCNSVTPTMASVIGMAVTVLAQQRVEALSSQLAATETD
ncbi:unnamed protein product [Polarella glacialis]|uniref:Uncharacterized protein n=1 Tax=Polarella glacialis TaxID=89957 RepID=A0A813JS50_POLGL|nr:unnamed protein product [Polarella glacialis]